LLPNIWNQSTKNLGAPSLPRTLREGREAIAPHRNERKLRMQATLSLWMKGAQALLLAIAVCFSLGATDAGSRYHDLSHRMMCTCGCAQILGECNHVGCTTSSTGLNELRTYISAGKSDQEILDSFVAKYGATVLAAPTGKGFDIVAWIAPFAVFAAALLGTILLVRRWAGLAMTKEQAEAQAAGLANQDPAVLSLRDQVRRDTDSNGGY